MTTSQIIAGCTLAAAANFDFVKTSTGFRGEGATIEHVQLMAACCERLAIARRDGRRMQVKASGGIRTLSDAVAMLEAGASRLGTSAGVWISREASSSAKPESRERERESPMSWRHYEEWEKERPGMQTRLFTDY